MTRDDSRFVARYGEALRDFLATGDESALERAHELGREALGGGLGILGILGIHLGAASGDAMALTPRTQARREATETFLYEALGPFEMTHRGFQDAVHALRRLNESMEDEIKRIAHALHDETSQYLASACVTLEQMGRYLSEGERTRVHRACEAIDLAIESVRRLSHELRPTILDDMGLIPAIQYLAEGIEARTGLRVSVQGSTGGRLSTAIETALYRIVQEAIANAIRHARCAAVSIRLSRENGDLCCSIRDDGTGFDVEEAARRTRRGLGLQGMRERVTSLGGVLGIESGSGQGTEVRLQIPAEG